MSKTVESIDDKIINFKKKFYANLMIKGAIFSLTIFSIIFIIVNSIEYFGRLNSLSRFILLALFISGSGYFIYKYFINPFLQFFGIKQSISNWQAANTIGHSLPEIKDKLLNTLQLRQYSSVGNSSLIQASILQRNLEFSSYNFEKSIDLSINKQYLKYLFVPLLIIATISFLIPNFFVDSTKRILLFNTTFRENLPFSFELLNKNLEVLRGQDLEIKFSANGKFIPSSVYINIDGRNNKLEQDIAGNYIFKINNIQSPQTFYVQSSGYQSDSYSISIIKNPLLLNSKMELKYPSYLKKSKEIINNLGNISIPEGTNITWYINTQHTDEIVFKLDSQPQFAKSNSTNTFIFNYKILNSKNYNIEFLNKENNRKNVAKYRIEVIKDQYPSIFLEESKDTISYKTISFGGILGDDYGITQLEFFYSINEANQKNQKLFRKKLSINLKDKEQKFFTVWNFDSLDLKPNQTLSYYFKVWDNDGVNGNKFTKSEIKNFSIPLESELKKESEKSANESLKAMMALANKSEIQKNEILNLENKIKAKNNLTWEDKKNVENLIQNFKASQSEVEKLKSEFDAFKNKEELFKESSPEIEEKKENLEKLMDSLMDEETKKLYDELQKLMSEMNDKQDVENLLQQLDQKEFSMENQLEKAIEQFKQIQFEEKLEDAIKDLNKISKDLDKESLLNSKNQENKQDLEKHVQVSQQFDAVQKKMLEANDLNNKLKEKNNFENPIKKQNDISELQNKAKDQLEKKQSGKAAESQKNGAKKTSQLAKDLQDMKDAMVGAQQENNLGDLRAILENTIKLSFDQEELMKEFRDINHTDPRYVALSQKQLKIKNDSKIIHDSLISLSKKVIEIQSFVTREVSLMNRAMDESVTFLKERKVESAQGKQQFAMTSINNLSLMLNDALKKMQEQMSKSNADGSKSCKKPGDKPGAKPGLGEMQQQLNNKIQELQKSGKQGKELSKELGNLAAQQELIRKALDQLSKKMDKKGKSSGTMDGLKKLMEETESNLVNKKIQPITNNRQQEILTRLLEAEKSVKERELDDKREAEQSKQYPSQPPINLSKYFEERQKQIELLKIISPQLNDFYRNETKEYFRKLNY